MNFTNTELETQFRTILNNTVSDDIIKQLVTISIDNEYTKLLVIKYAAKFCNIDTVNERLDMFIKQIETGRETH